MINRIQIPYAIFNYPCHLGVTLGMRTEMSNNKWVISTPPIFPQVNSFTVPNGPLGTLLKSIFDVHDTMPNA